MNERWVELCRPWKDALVITLLGRQRNRYQIKDKLDLLWGFKDYEIIDMLNNYFIIRFTLMHHCKLALTEGLWVIQGHYMAIQKWSSNFNPFSNTMKKLVVCARVPILPIH